MNLKPKPAQPNSADLTRLEAAADSNSTVGTIDKLIKAGILRAYPIGTGPRPGIRITRESFNAMRERQHTPHAPAESLRWIPGQREYS